MKVKYTKRNTTSSAVDDCGGSVRDLTYMAANGTGPLVFIDDFNAGGSNRRNADVYMSGLCPHIPSNAG